MALRRVSPRPDPAQVDAIVDVLSALEYGKKKEERELIDKTFGTFDIKRRATKVEVAPAIARSPGFERFFLAVVDEMKPFALMLSEVYAFLGRRATVGRRASTFHVTTAGAEAVFDFSLAAFPKHLLPLLMSGQVEQATMSLVLPHREEHGDDTLAKRWESLSGNWDNDFYDVWRGTRFFRLASYASLMRPRLSAADWSRIETAVEPVMDRLAALLEAFVAAGVKMNLPTGMLLLCGDLDLELHEARAYAARTPTPGQLAIPTPSVYGRSQTFEEFFGNLSKAWAVAVHLWRSPAQVRIGNKLEQGLPDGADDPARYPDALVGAAEAFTTRLDQVAPIVERQTQRLDVERLIEFTELPFWKHRWFLYELWTLMHVLDVAAAAGTITLEGLTQRSPGVWEWVLPGGTASSPVARITNGTRSVSVWTQLKSQHPETRAGLEPDLRIRMDRQPQDDLFLIENKDRLTISTGKLAEIARRYVTGTKVQGAWFVNYETFPPGTAALESTYPNRGVRVVSKFRPNNVPADFDSSLLAALGTELQPQSDPFLAVILEWTAPPDDLDLHAWLERGGVRAKVSHSARGSLSDAPYAALDHDERTGGAEQIVVSTRDLDRLVVAVNRYPSLGQAPFGRPTIRFVALDDQQHPKRTIGTRTVSGDNTAPWWHVLEMDAAGEIRWHDTFRAEPPLPL